MLRWIVEASLRHRILVIAAAAVLLTWGALRIGAMPVDAFPEFSPPVVEIQTEAVGLAANEVERLVTMPLEELLGGVSWVKSLHSESVGGLSVVHMVFEPGTDLMRARQLVQERLTLSYTLPSVTKPPVMMQPLSATSRVMMIGLSSEKMPLIQQSVIAQWTIKPKLLGVPGVANVAIWGERKRQLQVQVDPQKMRRAGVRPDQVVSSAGDSLYVASLSFLKASNPGSGGWIDGPNQRLEVRHVLPMSSAEDLGKVSLDGTKLRLSDVATIVEGHPPLVGDAIINGKPGLMLVVEKFPGANTLEVTRRIESALAAMRPGLTGLTIDHQVFRSAGFVEQAIAHHKTILLAGLTLLLLVLAVTLRSLAGAIIGTLSVGASVVAALLAINLSGGTLNTVVLAGLLLALAAVIDDVVIVVERILRRLRAPDEAASKRSTLSVIGEAVLESRRSAGHATLILLLLALPILFVGGLFGAFLKPLALAYVAAVAAAMVCANVLTPALAGVLLGKQPGQQTALPGWSSLLRTYDLWLGRSLAHPARVFALAAVVALIAAASWPFLSRSLLPQFDERDLVLQWDSQAGTSHTEMVRITGLAATELAALPGVRSVSGHLGRAFTGDLAAGVNSGQLWISLKPEADYAKTVADIEATVEGYPGVTGQLHSYLREQIREALTGAASPVAVRLYGPDRSVLASKAKEVRQHISQIKGITDLRVRDEVAEPQVLVTVNLAAAAKVGLKPGDVRRSAAAQFSGLEVGKIFEQQKVFDVVVWSAPEGRADLNGLSNTLIETPNAGFVKLADVSDISVQSTPTIIRHERGQPYLDVTANVAGRDIGAVVDEVQASLATVTFPLEHHAEIIGEQSERNHIRTRTIAVAAAAVIGALLLLQAITGSWGLAALCLAAVAASLSGGVLALLAFGGELSIGALAGFLGVLVLSVRQCVGLLQTYRVGTGPSLAMAGTAARERLAPVLVSALAVAGLLLPFVVLGPYQGLEIERPIAIVMLGGLITSTLAALFLLPAILLRFGSDVAANSDEGVI